MGTKEHHFLWRIPPPPPRVRRGEFHVKLNDQRGVIRIFCLRTSHERGCSRPTKNWNISKQLYFFSFCAQPGNSRKNYTRVNWNRNLNHQSEGERVQFWININECIHYFSPSTAGSHSQALVMAVFICRILKCLCNSRVVTQGRSCHQE